MAHLALLLCLPTRKCSVMNVILELLKYDLMHRSLAGVVKM